MMVMCRNRISAPKIHEMNIIKQLSQLRNIISLQILNSDVYTFHYFVRSSTALRFLPICEVIGMKT